MVWYVLLRPLRPELDGQQNHQIFHRTHMLYAWSANFKMVWYVLLRPLRPELDGQQNHQIFYRTHMHGLPILKWYGMSSCDL
jgi:hypothetical protein